MVDASLAWIKLDVRETWKPLADWSRIANTGSVSVQLGHVLQSRSLEAEVTEINRVYVIEEEQPAAQSPADLVERLNAGPLRCVAARGPGREPVQILGWGLWAAFLQRHLCHAITSEFEFMQHLWGVPQEAAEYRVKMDEFFWRLYLYPFVRRQNATEVDYYRKAQDEEMALVRSRPHIVPTSSWNIINYEVDFAPLYFPPPHPFVNEWHRYNPLPGTVYDILPRLNHPSMLNSGKPAEMVARLEQAHARAPYDLYVAHKLLEVRAGKEPSTRQILEVYGPTTDYAPDAAARIGRNESGDPVERAKWLNRWGQMNPRGYQELGDLYLELNKETEAAEAYQHWADEAIDQVSVANSIRWLVEYYERTGKPDQAMELADRAAKAYSFRGLQTKAILLEKRGDFAGALALYEQQAERYKDLGPLTMFLVRRREDASVDASYERRLTEVLKESVPNGLERFKLIPGEPPRRGVIVHTSAPLITKAGLQLNDVIVAVRGFRVDGWREFKTIRAYGERDAEAYTMIVWRDGSYQKIGPLPAGYRFGVDLADYKK